MKSKNIIIIIELIVIIFLGYLFWENANASTHIVKIDSITSNTITAYELEYIGDSTYLEYYRFLGDDAPIFDSNWKKIKVSDLKVGDTLAVILKPGAIITTTAPAILDDILRINVLKKTSDEIVE